MVGAAGPGRNHSSPPPTNGKPGRNGHHSPAAPADATVLDRARALVAGGLSVIPVGLDGTKRPAFAFLPREFDDRTGHAKPTWKPFQAAPPTDEDLVRWFGGAAPQAIAVVCGPVSGGAECLDFDDRETAAAFRARVREDLPELEARLSWEDTPAGGHAWYRCEVVDGNQELAHRPAADGGQASHKVLIETRGDGGYAVVAGSPPAAHKLGVPYRFAGGRPLEDLADITAAERDYLLRLARSFDQVAELEPVPEPADLPRTTALGGEASAIEEYDLRGPAFDELLGPDAEFTHPGKDRGQVRRPGKEDHGYSGTVGVCRGPRGEPLFKCFSSNWPPFKARGCYGRFNVLRLARFAGDGKAAFRHIREHGFGPRRDPGASAGPHVPPGDPGPAADDVAGIEDLRRAGAAVRWVWPGWIQRGVLTVVAAEGGTGKTRLAADLVRIVRHGLAWPDGSAQTIEPGGTVALWVVADNHHGEMVTLSDAFGIADCVKVNAPRADPYGGVSLDAPEDLAALERRVRAVQPLFVMVDTVGNATDRNLSRQEDAKAFYQPLQVLARRCDVAVLCLTHVNAGGKALGRRVLEKVRVAWRMTAERVADHTCRRRLEVIKSNSPYPPALGVTMTGTGNEYDSAPPPPPEDGATAGPTSAARSKLQECKDWLAAFLESRPHRVKDIRHLAEQKGFKASTLYQARNQLKLVEVDRDGKKWWRLPKKAKADA